MKKFCVILLAGMVFWGCNVQSVAAFSDAAVGNPVNLGTGADTNCQPSCNNGTQPPPPATDKKQAAPAAASTKSPGETNTKTVIPDPLGGALCEDLLACKDKNLNGAYLKPGVQESFVYRKMIPQLIKLLLNFGGGVAVLMMVYSGYLYLVSAGSEDMMKKAVNTIMYSLIGLVVMILSRAVVAIVENFPLG